MQSLNKQKALGESQLRSGRIPLARAPFHKVKMLLVSSSQFVSMSAKRLGHANRY